MTTVIVLAAGQGTRMNTTLPKVLHTLGGKCLVHYVLDVALSLNPSQVILVKSSQMNQGVITNGRSVTVAVQEVPNGTGGAVKAAWEKVKNPEDDVLLLFGDVPLIESSTLNQLLDQRRHFSSPAIWVLAMDLKDPKRYGRLKTKGNLVEAIVEYKDATPEEKSIQLCNSAIFLMPGTVLSALLPQLNTNNAAKEYYITDIVSLASKAQIPTYFVVADHPETLEGINNLQELASAERVLQNRWRNHFMSSGVKMIDPETIYLSHDTTIGCNTLLYPNVFLGPNVHIEKNVTLYPGCYIENAKIMEGAKVGPYAHLRGGTLLEPYAEVGNFVECKNTRFGTKAKAKHLSYLGDTVLGEKVNVGAGTITCNYDGFDKFPTSIGKEAFIGSNSTLIAPLSVGERAMVAAGSVVNKDVPKDSLVISRSPHVVKPEWATSFKERKQKGRK